MEGLGTGGDAVREVRWPTQDEGPSLTWVRLDENFPDHPKIVGLSDRAYRCFVDGICYANKYLTDGVVTIPVQRHLRCTKAVATELVRSGVWEIHELGAFLIHDYHSYQPSRADVEKVRADRATAGREGAKVTNMRRWRQQSVGKESAP